MHGMFTYIYHHLPTFTIKINQMYVNVQLMDAMGKYRN